MPHSFKRLFVAAGMLAVFAVPIFAAKAKVGEMAPDFTLTDIQGNTVSLSDFSGKTVVLEWVNPECPFVVKHYRSGNMPDLQSQAADDGAVWIAINSGSSGAQGDFSPTQAKKWLDKTGAAPAAYVRDQEGTVGRLYGAKTTPHMYVINPEGTLVYNGAIDSIPSANPRDLSRAKNYVQAAMAAVKSGELPAKASSQPYGCSVKY